LVFAYFDYDADDEGIYRVTLSHKDDSVESYLWAEYDPNAGELRLGKDDNTLATRTGITHNAIPEVQMTVCYMGDDEGGDWQLSAYLINDQPYGVWTSVAPPKPKPYYAGLENPGTTTLEWNRFTVSEHYRTNQSALPQCPPCWCNCGWKVVPDTLVLTITATGDCLADLNGQEFTLQIKESWWLGSNQVRSWEAESRYICGILWDFQLHCPNWGASVPDESKPTDFILCSFPTIPCPSEMGIPNIPDEDMPEGIGCSREPMEQQFTRRTFAEDGECEPFYLKWGPYTVDNPYRPFQGDYACTCCEGTPPADGAGTIMFEIQEAP